MRKKQNDERYQNAIYLHYFLCPAGGEYSDSKKKYSKLGLVSLTMTSVNTKVTGFLSYCDQHNSHFKMYGPTRVKKAHKGGNGFTQI